MFLNSHLSIATLRKRKLARAHHHLSLPSRFSWNVQISLPDFTALHQKGQQYLSFIIYYLLVDHLVFFLCVLHTELTISYNSHCQSNLVNINMIDSVL